jgi:hypothetical protein
MVLLAKWGRGFGRILNTRLPQLYFNDVAYLFLQHNLGRIEPLLPRGMSGQVECRM